MTKEQLDVIAGLIKGTEAAVVHLTHLLIQQADLNKESVAASFEASANLLHNATHAAQMQAVMRNVAKGIRGGGTPGDFLRIIPSPPL